MILLDVATELKKKYGYEEIPINDLVDVLRDGFGAMVSAMSEEGVGSYLSIPKFGVFKLIKRPARVARNPQTGKQMNVPEKTGFKFKASNVLKNELLSITKVFEKQVKAKKDDKKKSKKKK